MLEAYDNICPILAGHVCVSYNKATDIFSHYVLLAEGYKTRFEDY